MSASPLANVLPDSLGSGQPDGVGFLAARNRPSIDITARSQPRVELASKSM
jgi:hypothetical protein